MAAITDLLLSDIMAAPVHTLAQERSLGEALAAMAADRISSLVVVDGNRPVGILTERDAVRLFDEQADQSQPVCHYMSAPVLTASAALDFRAAYRLLASHRVRHLVVVDKSGSVVGIVSETDFRGRLGLDILRKVQSLQSVMDAAPLVLPATAPLAAAIHAMALGRAECVVVTEGERAVGIVTERDMPQLLARHVEPGCVRLAEVMAAPVRSVAIGDGMAAAIDLMSAHQIRHVVVVDADDRLLGTLSQHRLLEKVGSLIIDDAWAHKHSAELARDFIESRLDQVLTATAAGLWSISADGVHWHESLLRMLGCPPEQAPASVDEWLALVHPEDRPALRQHFESARAGAADQVPVFEIDCRTGGCCGGWRWLHLRGGLLSAGEATVLAGTAMDVTLRRNANYLLDVENRFSRLLAEEPDRDLLLDAMVTAVLRLPQIDGAAVLVDGPGGRLALARQQGLSPEVAERLAGLGSDEAAVVALTEGGSVCSCRQLTALCRRDQGLSRYLAAGTNGQAAALLPIRAEGELRACLFAQARQAESLGDDVMLTLDTLARQLSQSLSRLEAIERNRAQQTELRRNEALLRTLIDAVPDAISFKDGDGRWLLANDFQLELFNLAGFDYRGKTDRELADLVPGFRDSFLTCAESDERAWQGGDRLRADETIRGADGSEAIFDIIKVPMFRDDGSRQGLIVVARDVSERKRAEQQLQHLAHYDSLTQLPNRVLVTDRLRIATARAKRTGKLLAVCYLDLDGFKPINDGHGHDTGDHLLIEVANRLSGSLRAGDSVGRLGGDEFVLLLGELADEGECRRALDRILSALSRPYHVGGLNLNLSASIGVTLYPLDAMDCDTLLRHADQAMYEAKEAGRNRYCFFDPRRNQRMRDRREAFSRVRRGLRDHEMVLHFQPMMDLRTGAVPAVEALVRWRHPERGLLLPSQFLPQIADTEAMAELDFWVLEQALQQARQWRTAGLELSVSVNVGAHTLAREDFPLRLGNLVESFPELPANTLEIEIIESVALDDLNRASVIIEDCRRMGIEFALDDFGTGYSSLLYLRHLPANVLKIDRSFVRDMLDDPGDLAIVEGIIGLAAAFQRRVVAEGVESTEIGVRLLELGCTLAQGYAIAAPMPADRLQAWIRDYRRPAAWLRG